MNLLHLVEDFVRGLSLLQALWSFCRNIFSQLASSILSRLHNWKMAGHPARICDQSLFTWQGLWQLWIARHEFLIYSNTLRCIVHRVQLEAKSFSVFQSPAADTRCFSPVVDTQVFTALIFMGYNQGEIYLSSFSHNWKRNIWGNQKGPKFTKENNMSILLNTNSFEIYQNYLSNYNSCSGPETSD